MKYFATELSLRLVQTGPGNWCAKNWNMEKATYTVEETVAGMMEQVSNVRSLWDISGMANSSSPRLTRRPEIRHQGSFSDLLVRRFPGKRVKCSCPIGLILHHLSLEPLMCSHGKRLGMLKM
ncbi:hypothetical protein F5Y17DRAFT_381933 [Xylariaceae sp. FL0594]|nr:hypothetical protein F5Y17DRAFT_381933 [Xylariaceae sp. FL0594]